MVVIAIVRWGYKPTYNVWGPHVLELCAGFVAAKIVGGFLEVESELSSELWVIRPYEKMLCAYTCETPVCSTKRM